MVSTIISPLLCMSDRASVSDVGMESFSSSAVPQGVSSCCFLSEQAVISKIQRSVMNVRIFAG